MPCDTTRYKVTENKHSLCEIEIQLCDYNKLKFSEGEHAKQTQRSPSVTVLKAVSSQ